MDLVSNPAQNEGPKILAATLTVTAAALIVVLARLYVRIGIIHSFGTDDAVTTFAMATSIAGVAFVVSSVHYGAGRHAGDIDPHDFVIGMKLNFVSQELYLAGICLVKLSVGFSLLRVATKKIHKRVIASIMAFMAAYTIALSALTQTLVVQCDDIRVLWDPSVVSGCWSTQTLQGLSYTNAAITILTDLIFATIPIAILWHLEVHRRARLRISLIVVLALGLFAVAAACVKTSYLPNYGRHGDFLWDTRDITIWTATEMNVGIVAGSLPTLRPMFKRFLGSNDRREQKPRPGGAGAHKELRGDDWKALASSEEAKRVDRELSRFETMERGTDPAALEAGFAGSVPPSSPGSSIMKPGVSPVAFPKR
ncbi:integral membrane family protein [Colletotrichum plurivorum]|uniref:Integral membrane family protein n=1 Tax=Colletotrichum plurivorum TaxID=2175906 RepID=A0A8H6J8H9_9PEZI|nr:integral membrane family protein [Colletotrichum plurivorum]